MARRIQFSPKPGIAPAPDKTAVDTGQWIDGDNVIFWRGDLWKSPGWAAVSLSTAISGVARWMFGYQTGVSKLTVVATNSKLYSALGNTSTNITPLVSGTTALPNDPVSTTNGSATVTITVTASGDCPAAGDRVKLGGLTTTGGVLNTTLNAEHIVVTTPTSTTFTIAATTASSTATGGGASGTIQNEIADGSADSGYGYGVGFGLPGAGTPGAGATSTATVPPRIYSGDIYGNNLVLTPGGQTGAYEWTGTTATAPTLITNAPTAINFLFVTNNIVVTLGASATGNRIKWSDQGDNTTWTAAADNQAGEDDIEGAGTFRSAININGTNLLFTDWQVYEFVYVGAPFIFNTRKIDDSSGIIGAAAVNTLNGVAYFMSGNSFHRWYGGRVEHIPGAPREYVFSRLYSSQKEKCHVAVFPTYGIVRFYYPSTDGSGEIDSYVDYSPEQGIWWIGSQNRTASRRGQYFDGPRLITSAGALYDHESGNDDGSSAMEFSAVSPKISLGNGDETYCVRAFIPDGTQTGNYRVKIRTWATAQAPTYYETEAYTISPTTGRINTRARGRYAQIVIEGDELGSDLKLGLPYLEVERAGMR